VARADLSDAADVVALVATFLAPIVPSVTDKLFAQLGTAPVTFADLAKARLPLLPRGRALGTPAPILPRLEEAQVNKLVPPEEIERLAAVSTSASAAKAARAEQASAASGKDREPEEIDIDAFARVALVGQVLAGRPKADKLLKLTVMGEASPHVVAASLSSRSACHARWSWSQTSSSTRQARVAGDAARGREWGASLRLVDLGICRRAVR
jgi:methionyl-tRNA synthetase